MVRTRFAPSPTGYLHIGGVRTALFNWLFARKHGGTFILRIDDTDQQRNVEQALRPILDGFRWLGLDWDEGAEVGGPHGPYYQSQRQDLYRQAVADLVARELAYWDYATSEEMAAERAAAEAAGRPFVYSRRHRAASEAERQRLAAEGRTGVVRLAMPREGACHFVDLVRGEVVVEWAREQDHVVQRADGTCLYNLASVVDDQTMGITHVIRAEEHLANTPRQIFIARGLDYALPTYAHLPFVAEPGSRNKLSKRKLEQYLKHPEFAKLHARGRRIADALGLSVAAETFNPVIVDFYRQIGFLPEAIVNYLLLLGWSLDDRTEFFSRERMIEAFGLERVNKAPASFDPQKLTAFQSRYMQARTLAERCALTLPFLTRAGWLTDPPPPEQAELLRRVVEAAGDRLEIAGDILDYRAFFLPDASLDYDEAALAKWLRAPGAAELLRELADRLAGVAPWEPAALEAATAGFVRERGIKPGPAAQAVRVAVTGQAVGFGLYEALAILGRERCRARIVRALERV